MLQKCYRMDKIMKKKISITIDKDIIEAIKKEAEEQQRSFSNMIEFIIKKELNNKETIDKL